MSRHWVSLGVQGMLIFTSLLTVGCNSLSHRKFWGDKDDEHQPALSQTVRPGKSVTARKEWEAPDTEAAFALDAELDEHPTALASATEPISDSAPSPASSPAVSLSSNAISRGTVVTISGGSFEQEVLECATPVLVDFYAPWCGPCKQMAPVLDRFAAETPDVKVVKVDIEQAPNVAKKYRIESVPTLLVFKDGELTARHDRKATREKMDELMTR